MNSLLFILFVILGYLTGYFLYAVLNVKEENKLRKIKVYIFKTTCEFIEEKYGKDAVKDFRIYFVEKVKEEENE